MPAGQVPFGYLPPNGYPPQGQVPIGPYGYPPLGPYGLPPQMLALGPPLGVYPCGYEPARRDRSRSRSANRRKGKADAHAERARSVLTTTMQKTKMCDFHKDGRCKYGKGCAFAHEEEELKIMPDLRKTRICRSFSQGSCSNANCKYAHGNEELRSTDMCYKTAMCTWFEKGNCQSGDQCRFAHGVEELRKEDEDNDAAASSAAVPSADGVAAAAPAAGDSSGGIPAAPEGTVAPESKKNTRRQRQRQKRKPRATAPLALVLPPDSIGEIIVVEGGLNFLNLYQGLLTIRILLSWFPQAQGVGLLRPIFTVSDAYLNLFRGIVPPIGGIDISPIGAFFVLNLLQNSVASLAATGTPTTVQSRTAPGTQFLRRLLREPVSAAA